MANFITDPTGTTFPSASWQGDLGKSDYLPLPSGAMAWQWLSSGDVNAITGALKDLRTAAISGAAVSSSLSGVTGQSFQALSSSFIAVSSSLVPTVSAMSFSLTAMSTVVASTSQSLTAVSTSLSGVRSTDLPYLYANLTAAQGDITNLSTFTSGAVSSLSSTLYNVSSSYVYVSGDLSTKMAAMSGVLYGRNAIGDFFVYVDPISGSDSNIGSQASPVQTIQHALTLMPMAWTGKCRMILASGTYTVGNLHVRSGFSMGPNGEPMVIQGAVSGSSLGTRTVTATGTTTSGYVYQVTDSSLSGTITSNAYVGSFVRFKSGLGNNYVRLIRSNDTNGMFEMSLPMFVLGGTGSVSIGDTFVIEQPSTNIVVTGALEFNSVDRVGVNGLAIVLDQMRFTLSSSGYIYAANAGIAGTEIQMFLSSSVMSITDSVVQFGVPANSYDSQFSDLLGYDKYGCGAYITGSSTQAFLVLDHSNFNHYGSVVRGGAHLRFWGPACYGNFYSVDIGGGALEIGGHSHARIGPMFGLNSTLHDSPTDMVTVDNGGCIEKLGGVNISNNAGHGVKIIFNSTCQIDQPVYGSGNGGAGLAIGGFSTVVSLTTGSTLTGTQGEIYGYHTAATSTWAAIDSGTLFASFPDGMMTKYG